MNTFGSIYKHFTHTDLLPGVKKNLPPQKREEGVLEKDFLLFYERKKGLEIR